FLDDGVGLRKDGPLLGRVERRDGQRENEKATEGARHRDKNNTQRVSIRRTKALTPGGASWIARTTGAPATTRPKPTHRACVTGEFAVRMRRAISFAAGPGPQ